VEPGRSLAQRLRATGPFAQDAALALGLLVLTFVELVALGGLGGYDPRPPVLWPVLAVATTAPLAWRRTRPLAASAALVVAETATAVVSGHFAFSAVLIVSLLIGAYSAGAHSRSRRWSLFLILAMGVAPGLALGVTRVMSGIPGLTAVIPLTAWLIGHAVRGNRLQIASLEERALRLEREREATTRAAIAEERARIARELHDVVAHGVSVMVVQAEAARRVLRREPALAEEALRTVSATGSEALGELRHLLGVLADGEAGPELEPAPGLRDLDALVERVRSAGVDVEVRLDGEIRTLPRGLDLTAYRIVQEALTNVLKHAGATRAAVRLRFAPEALGIEVTDAGRSQVRAEGAGGGRGLPGMRARVAAYGGDLETGPGAEGGYAVRVRLPLESGT
jgi:signal transduction histidine kinase